jgi:GNAT superfamily N-acetyltransferase
MAGAGPREATADDAAAVAAIHMASRAATMPYLPPQRRTVEQVTAWARDDLIGHCRVWVAGPAEGPVAYAALDGDHLEHLYVHPDHLRRGWGGQLLTVAKQSSPGHLWLHVFQQNIAAITFYGAHGFDVVESSDGSRNMELLPDLTMRWTASETRGPSASS